MRVAVVLAGHLRGWDFYGPALIENVLQPLSADLFVHTWDTGGQKLWIGEILCGPSPDDNFTVDYESAIRLLQPKRYVVENRLRLHNEGLFDARVRRHMYVFWAQARPEYINSQLYSIYRANRLRTEYEREHGFEYDLVIRLRLDYGPIDEVPEDEIAELMESPPDRIFVPQAAYSQHGHEPCRWCQTRGTHNGPHDLEVCDVFAFGRGSVMDHCCNLFLKAGEVYDKAREELKPDPNDLGAVPFYKNVSLINAYPWEIRFHYPCYYPERLLMHHLAGFWLRGSRFTRVGDKKKRRR